MKENMEEIIKEESNLLLPQETKLPSRSRPKRALEPEITLQDEKDQRKDLTPPRKIDPDEELKAERARKLAWLKARDAQIVRGKFMNIEQPGMRLEFNYKAYKGDPVARYELDCGGVYDIPFGVAIHLNENCSKPVYQLVPGEKKMIAGENPDARGVMKITSKINRFLFQPLNFSEKDYVGIKSNKILQVETVG